jgi:hypothetical protein
MKCYWDKKVQGSNLRAPLSINFIWIKVFSVAYSKLLNIFSIDCLFDKTLRVTLVNGLTVTAHLPRLSEILTFLL